MRCFYPVTMLIGVVLPFVVQARDVYYQGDLTPLNILPSFDKGYLAVYEPEHAISLYRPDGSLAYKVTARVPHATFIHVVNAAPDSDGSLALAVEYKIDKSRGGGVAVFDPNGSQAAFIDTGADYAPTQVCFGPDHSIWAIGWRGWDFYSTLTSTTDYFVLRNYARDGRLLGGSLRRSSFDQEPVGPIVGGWQLRIANDRIGAYFYTTSVLPFGIAHRAGQWIETDLSGKVLRQVDTPQKSIRAFPGDGPLYALGYQGGYSVLDPVTNSWRAISAAGSLLGTDGDSLVLLEGTNRVVWSPLE